MKKDESLNLCISHSVDFKHDSSCTGIKRSENCKLCMNVKV